METKIYTNQLDRKHGKYGRWPKGPWDKEPEDKMPCVGPTASCNEEDGD